VVAGLLAQRLSHNAATPVGAPTPTATPSADYGPPPTGVELLYVHDPNHPTWLIGYDWTGRPRSTVKLTDLQPNVGMAPDGQSFAIGLGAKGGNWQFLDRLGQPIATPSTLPGAYSTLWADDNQHVCSMTFDQQTLDYTLWTALPGQSIKRVMVVAHDPNVGQTGVSLAACSFKNDQAIAVRTTISYPSEIWVVRLSDGKLLAHRSFADGALANVVASSDATYIAENTSDTARIGAPYSPGVTRIRRVSDWAQVATVGSFAVSAFSGDDSLVLLTGSLLIEVPSRLEVVDWASGSVLWSYQGSEALGGFIAEPGGRGFAVALTEPAQIEAPPRDVVIVHGDGTAIQIPGRYEPAW